ncbi:MAG TPA: hypothetical protein VMS56_11600 [Thermoanaerobaculia bacterium]|nr:hypothetical protein [Thermoanaerobaculia bacterium]
MTRGHIGILVLLSFVLVLQPACRTADSVPLRSSPAVTTPEPTEGITGDDRRSAREAWFLRQRLQPFDSIDGDVRAEALEAIRRMDPLRDAAIAVDADGEMPAWESIGPAPTESYYPDRWQQTSGRIRAVAISPADPELVLIGSSTGGIWRSSDGGETFVPVSDDQSDLSVASIVFAPSRPETVYAAMGAEFLGMGVLRSDDGGATWRRIDESGLPAMGHAQRIAVAPANPELVLLAQSWRLHDEGDLEVSGIYQSIDGGRTWEPRLSGFATDVVFDPVDSSIAWAALQNSFVENRSATLHRSDDGGTSWELAFTGPFEPTSSVTFRIAISPARPRKITLFSTGFRAGYTNFVSEDHGQTWEERPQSDVRGRALLFEASPEDPDVLYLGQFVDLFRSTDGGSTWTNLTLNRSPEGWDSRTHPDQFSIAFIPESNGEFLLGNDGGLYRSSEGGTKFTHLNDGLSLTQIYGIAAHPHRRGVLFIGTQDNGFQVRRPEDGSWKELGTGDYGRPWIDPLRGDRVCINYIFTVIYCFTDYGAKLERLIGGDPAFDFEEEGAFPRVAFLAPLRGNPIDRTLYFGTWRLWVTTDVGETWTAPAGELDLTYGGEDVLTAIAPAESNRDVVYTGSSEGRVMRSVDRGVSWQDVSEGIPRRWITSLTVHPGDPDLVWVTLSGFRASHVFASDDGGTSWRDLQSNLPDIPANTLWADPRHDGMRLLLGTDLGVFRTVDGGESWAPFNRGIPPVIVNDFVLGPDGKLYAATYGRGVYAVRLESEPRRRPVTR